MSRNPYKVMVVLRSSCLSGTVTRRYPTALAAFGAMPHLKAKYEPHYANVDVIYLGKDGA